MPRAPSPPGAVAVLTLAACSGADKGTPRPVEAVSVDGAITTRRGAWLTASDGLARVAVPVEEGDESLLLVARHDTLWPAVERVLDPDGAEVSAWSDWATGTEVLTNGFSAETTDVVFNWPVRDSDPPLTAGEWVLEVAATDLDGWTVPDVSLDVVTQVRHGIGSGAVHAVVVTTGELEPAVAEAVEAAINHWEGVWERHGLELVREAPTAALLATPLASATDLPAARSGDPALEEAAALGSDSDLLVLIGESVAGEPTALGGAGSIPGALVATPRAAVVVSWLAHAGADGTLDPSEQRLLGETLAHESGHYLGLVHPVERDWLHWDALEDTPRCADADACEEALGDNLMFPYPLCDWEGCLPQGQLTEGQQGVAWRYTGTQ